MSSSMLGRVVCGIDPRDVQKRNKQWYINAEYLEEKTVRLVFMIENGYRFSTYTLRPLLSLTDSVLSFQGIVDRETMLPVQLDEIRSGVEYVITYRTGYNTVPGDTQLTAFIELTLNADNPHPFFRTTQQFHGVYKKRGPYGICFRVAEPGPVKEEEDDGLERVERPPK